jgi:hypothetical protein
MPIWPTMTLGSEAYAKFQRQIPEWMNNPNFHERLKSIVERKREDFYEREARRRLVD